MDWQQEAWEFVTQTEMYVSAECSVGLAVLVPKHQRCDSRKSSWLSPKGYCSPRPLVDLNGSTWSYKVCSIPLRGMAERHWGPISRETVNRRLVKRGYRARRVTKKPHHKRLNLCVAITIALWTTANQVLLGDEPRFLCRKWSRPYARGGSIWVMTPCTTWLTVCRVVWQPSPVLMEVTLIIKGLLTLLNIFELWFNMI